MLTVASTKRFPFGQHPDILDEHSQELYRAPDGSYRVIFRVAIRPGFSDGASIVAALQVPSTRASEAGLWHALAHTSLRDYLMFFAKLHLIRREPRWAAHGRIPKRVIQDVTLPDTLFSRLLMLPHDLSLAAGWDIEDFCREADERLAEVRERDTHKCLLAAKG